jgi:pimeloyl-ACP methyl ester carboxylesterase
MRFRCPTCGFRGGVRIPPHLPKGKTVRIRCSRCKKMFPLRLGRLFPQEHRESYRALVPDSLGCRGTKVGRLWLESVGSPQDRIPVVALPAHPALSHDVMHDLLDPFHEYFRICYLEFPGTRRNPRGLEDRPYALLLREHLFLIKKHLGASRFHVLAHLCSAPLALEIAGHQPDSVASVILLEPDFCMTGREQRGASGRRLREIIRGSNGWRDPGKQVFSVLQQVWHAMPPGQHSAGLAKILAPGFRAENLRDSLAYSRRLLRYPALSRLRTPVLILYAREGGVKARRDVRYLEATLRSVQTASVEGGSWAAWFGSTWFGNKLMSFKRAAEGEGRPPARRRSRTLNGQPLGWMILAFVLLAAGLGLGSGYFHFQPEYMARVIPPLLAGLLPIFWFLIPKKIDPLVFLRFRGFSARSVLLPVAAGILSGLFFRGLLLTLGSFSLPLSLPPPLASSVASIAAGDQGRLLELAGILLSSLFVFGVAENLWVLRRSALQILMPTFLFTLFPPAFPDILWKLPVGFMAATLFAGSLSIYSPLFLMGAFAASTELSIPVEQLPISWQSPQGVAVTTAALAAAVLLCVTLGTGGKAIAPEDQYFVNTINREGRPFRWGVSLGIVIVFFSLIAASGLIFGFLAI